MTERNCPFDTRREFAVALAAVLGAILIGTVVHANSTGANIRILSNEYLTNNSCNALDSGIKGIFISNFANNEFFDFVTDDLREFRFVDLANAKSDTLFRANRNWDLFAASPRKIREGISGFRRIGRFVTTSSDNQFFCRSISRIQHTKSPSEKFMFYTNALA